MPTPLADRLKEIDLVKQECFTLFSDLRTFHPLAPGASYPETYRLMVVPLLYAAWERCFVLCNAVAWRRVREECATAATLRGAERAPWLMQAGFYQSFTQTLLNSATAGQKAKLKKSHFTVLAEFLDALDVWAAGPLDGMIDTDELVMTFSNVNGDVVELNSKAIGIDAFPAFAAIKFGRLHDLVGLRNNIGHGGTLKPPDNGAFIDLWTFTEQLIEQYCETFKSWMQVRFAPPPPPPSRMKRVFTAAAGLLRALFD